VKLKKLTQRIRADNLVGQVAIHMDDPPIDVDVQPPRGLYALHKTLEEVLDEAQVSPPEGYADGSVDAPHYDKLRAVQHATQTLIWAIERWNAGKQK
jgi:hypothetical protein